ncbi:MAG: ADP-ribosylglycohydrolase family protein [Armatimonadetes bacterium]|nr:ADP-ribosylglycohydrolase family protein [Armatimonadota bacterium]
MTENAIIGCLLGTAVGDALGLPCEGLSRGRQARLFPDIRRYHFLFGRGMVSDDTEHTVIVAQALMESSGDLALFPQHLARRLRRWLWTLPAGVGKATLLACLRLSVGVPPDRSGVFSAGNGPAMRSALLGLCCPEDPKKLRALVKASTRLTHTDPKAEWGALAVALAASLDSRPGNVRPQDYLTWLQASLEPEAGELIGLVQRAVASACAGESADAFSDALGLQRGVSGYVYHTVPVVIQTWLRHQEDFECGLTEIIRCGGDTDTTAAILGGLIGACVGKAGIPPPLLDGLWEWPHSVEWMERLGRRLAAAMETGQPAAPPPAHSGFLRNLLFLFVVLAHGFRRLLPPYEI